MIHTVADFSRKTPSPTPPSPPQSQYKFIYEAVVEYLVSFDNYANFK